MEAGWGAAVPFSMLAPTRGCLATWVAVRIDSVAPSHAYPFAPAYGGDVSRLACSVD